MFPIFFFFQEFNDPSIVPRRGALECKKKVERRGKKRFLVRVVKCKNVNPIPGFSRDYVDVFGTRREWILHLIATYTGSWHSLNPPTVISQVRAKHIWIIKFYDSEIPVFRRRGVFCVCFSINSRVLFVVRIGP